MRMAAGFMMNRGLASAWVAWNEMVEERLLAAVEARLAAEERQEVEAKRAAALAPIRVSARAS